MSLYSCFVYIVAFSTCCCVVPATSASNSYDSTAVNGYETPTTPTTTSTTPISIASGYEEELQELMEKVYDDKSKTRDGKWSKCNIQQVASGIQKAAQEKFGVDFETVAGTGDFASRSHFSADYVCKIKAGPQYILAYATPQY